MARPPVIEEFPGVVEKFWDYSRNATICPEKVTAGSSKKVWWSCGKHWWKAVISSVVLNGRRCPYCKGSRPWAGETDLGTVYKDIVDRYWDYGKNAQSPSEFMPRSEQKVWWTCGDHSWKAVIKSVTLQGNRCPYCVGYYRTPGINDISTTHPELIQAFWDPSMNPDVDIKIIGSSNNTTSMTWRDNNYTWESTTSSLVNYGPPHRRVLSYTHPELVSNSWDYTKNTDISPDEVSKGSDRVVWWTCGKHSWPARVYSLVAGSGCPFCKPKYSKGEKEVVSFIRDELKYSGTILENHRIPGSRRDLDIYLPELALGLEYNGTFSHSTYYGDRPAKRDRLKYDEAQAAGIRVVAVWSDDWQIRPEVVKKFIRNLLGMNEDKVYARKCSVVQVSTASSRKFLDENHIQGFGSGSIKVGLKDSFGELVAVMVLRRERNDTVQLVRYATNKLVPGGHSKLIKHVETTYKYKYLVTYADVGTSSGDLYQKTGWTLDGEVPVSYWYIVNNIRVNKRQYRLSRFRNDHGLKFDPSLSEKDNSVVNGLHRVYDYGKLRFIKPHPNHKDVI